jgi:hypothetical protein
MNHATSASSIVVQLFLTELIPSILSILGLILVSAFAVYGGLKVYALLSGKSSESGFYKIGQMYGSEIYESKYQKYKSRRIKRDSDYRFATRYRREKF